MFSLHQNCLGFQKKEYGIFFYSIQFNRMTSCTNKKIWNHQQTYVTWVSSWDANRTHFDCMFLWHLSLPHILRSWMPQLVTRVGYIINYDQWNARISYNQDRDEILEQCSKSIQNLST